MANASVEFLKGSVSIDNEAIAQICGVITTSCYGVVGMAYSSKSKGIVSLLVKDKISKGVDVFVSPDKKISVDIHIIVEYGVNIQTISDSIISNVRYHLEYMTGLEIDRVNVYVDGTRVRE